MANHATERLAKRGGKKKKATNAYTFSFERSLFHSFIEHPYTLLYISCGLRLMF